LAIIELIFAKKALLCHSYAFNPFSALKHTFHILPRQRNTAPKNMALDLLLLEAYPQEDAFRLRLYDWEGVSFTFGYSQKLEWIRSQCATNATDIIRRPSGGGLVDHRDDWTFAFVVPPTHPLYRGHAKEVYRLVHEALAKALTDNGQPAGLAPKRPEGIPAGLQGLCFAAPEPHDVVVANTYTKIAGAAMKRTQKGLLLQGSAERKLAPGVKDWEKVGADFCKHLMQHFDTTPAEEVEAPVYEDTLWKKEVARFSSEKWNAKR
jgi:lipoate-protein ligase A